MDFHCFAVKTRVIRGLISSSQSTPETRVCAGKIDALITRAQCVFVDHVSLQPNFRLQHRAYTQLTTQRATIDEHFEFDTFEIEANPEQLTTRQRIRQRLERDHTPRETPIIFV